MVSPELSGTLCQHNSVRCHRNSSAVDAVHGIDVEHHVVLVEALDRTDHAAVGVLAIEARLANGVSHAYWFLSSHKRREADQAATADAIIDARFREANHEISRIPL